MKMSVMLLVGLATACLAACGGASNAATTPQATSDPGATSPAAASPSPTVPAQDAATIITAMAQRDGHLKASVTYTAVTDENHLLGRPGQYTSKSTFTDGQISSDDTVGTKAGDIDLGGGVEAFSNVSDAQKRAQYVASTSQIVAAFAEYDYVSGTALLRVSHYLTPDQAAKVEADFAAVTGQSAVAVTPS